MSRANDLLITDPADPVLLATARAAQEDEVTDVERLLHEFLQDPKSGVKGVGLAAPQIGISLRIFVVEIAPADVMTSSLPPPQAPEYYTVVNPQILQSSGQTQTFEEGCFSLPDQYYRITRPSRIQVEFQDREMQTQRMTLQGFSAAAFQHEYDHLNGVLITHRAKQQGTLTSSRSL